MKKMTLTMDHSDVMATNTTKPNGNAPPAKRKSSQQCYATGGPRVDETRSGV